MPNMGDLFNNRYVVDRVLGEGGFAVVYAGRDKTTNRPVALKVLRPEGSEYPPEVVSRFEREVKVVANLSDPHTVTLFDFGRTPAGLLFLVFEYVPGLDLSEFIRQNGPLSEKDASYVLTQLLRSLREAHRAGLLHRDIKPENIRIYEYAGDPLKVKVLDFGIARPAAVQQSQITQPGQLVGTPHYMSPEQLLAQDLTPASDLYSAGILLLEMLVGHPAEHGQSWADQLARLREGHRIEVPSHVGTSPAMRMILQKLCARDPAERFQSAGEVLRHLNEPVSMDGPGWVPLQRPEAKTLPYIRKDDSRSGTTSNNPVVAEPPPLTKFWVFGTLLIILLGVALGVVAHLATRTDTAPAVANPQVNSTKRPVALVRPPEPPAPAVTADLGATKIDAGPDLGSVPEVGSAGCGRKEMRSGLVMMGTDGISTPYRAFIPRDYSPNVPHPVIFLFHDAGRAPDILLTEGKFAALADREGIILVAPADQMVIDGTGFYGRVWEARTTTVPVKAMWQDLQDALCVDRSRLYLVGQAAGGYAVERLMCEWPITAAATNAHIKLPDDPTCRPKPAVPYMKMWGIGDRFVPKKGGVNCGQVTKMSWEDSINRWRDYNQIQGRGETWEGVGPSECTIWNGEADFVQCTISGGREWPGVSRPLWAMVNACGGETVHFDAASMVWKFFAAQPPIKHYSEP